MERIFDTYKPKGFHTVTTHLFVDNPQELIDFLKEGGNFHILSEKFQ